MGGGYEERTSKGLMIQEIIKEKISLKETGPRLKKKKSHTHMAHRVAFKLRQYRFQPVVHGASLLPLSGIFQRLTLTLL